MTMQARFFPVAVWVVILFSVTSFAQTPERRSTNSTPQAQEQLPNLPSSASSIETVANEIGLLRKSLQTLNTRLREITEKMLATDASQSGPPNDKQNRISANLDLLTRAEQRAEILRRQLLELIEKETSLRSRLVQIEEEMRPESIERALNPVGSTRSVELRDVRRRVLDNERRGYESLLNQTAQSRLRLDDDVKQADAMVFRIRQRILPLIEKEIEKINPN
jgi:prefoldin subunit 5